jgi:hypothetical protein
MKKILSGALLLLLASLSNAATHTVDNTVGSGAQFTTIAAAISAATPGDTILVHSSQYNYGVVAVNKHVVLIGPGHHPEVNQFLPASVSAFSLINGCDGTVIEGFSIGNIESPVFQNANNISIRNNLFNSFAWIAGSYGDFSNADNWLIEGNVMIGVPGCSGCDYINLRQSAGGNDNWTIRNNYMETLVGVNDNTLFAGTNSTTVIANNIIVHNNTSPMFELCSFSLLENNIFWLSAGQTNMLTGTSNCGFNNNLFYGTLATIDDVAGVANIMNENPQFVSLVDDVITWNYSNDFHLSAGSPAIGTAADGNDLGLFGADYNFRMEGYTNDIPRLSQVLPQYLVVPQNGTFTIDFSAKGAGH